MRWSLLLLLVAIPTLAFAEPRVAVAPLDGDGEDGKLADIVADAAGERAKVTKQGRTEGAMRSLGVSKLSAKSVKKLRNKLDVDVVIYGTVEDDRVSLQLTGTGKAKLDVEYKSAKQLRKDLAAKLPKKIAAAMQGSEGDAEAEEEEARAKREKEEEERRAERARKEEEQRRKEDEQRRKDEEDRRKREEEEERRASRKKDKKRGDDDEDGRRKKRVADRDDDDRDRRKRDDDEDEGDRRKKRIADRDEETDDGEDEDRPRKKRKRRGDEQRHALTQAALWLDAGAAFARRTLTYQATGMMQPPALGTAAPAGRIEGEVYPAAFSSLQGPAAGIGLVAAYSRTFALGIAVPGTQIVAPVANGHAAIGARYRITFGEHAVGFGLSYWRTWYKADRTKLMNPDQLDMPDVDYSAIAPGVAARIGVTPKVAAFATLDVPLMLYSGPIQDPATGYGSSKILAFDFRGGAQIELASHVALQIGLDVEQVGLTFTGQAGSKSVTRMVSKATDRQIGLGATIGINY